MVIQRRRGRRTDYSPHDESGALGERADAAYRGDRACTAGVGTTLRCHRRHRATRPRPNTVISVADPRHTVRVSADIVVTQIGPATIEVAANGEYHAAQVEFFRAETVTCQRKRVLSRPAELVE